MVGGAWRATVHSVTESQTRLKHLSKQAGWSPGIKTPGYKEVTWASESTRERGHRGDCLMPIGGDR